MAKKKLPAVASRAPKNLKKEDIKAKTEKIQEELDELQNLLYAERKHALLLVIQGMDASGKDGLIRDVCSRMNPQGVKVASFKQPTAEELGHDFLWRIHKEVPEKGMITIFNRSHYEDVLVTRVHGMIDDATAKKRMQAINGFERLLAEHNNTAIIKCYLRVTPDVQAERLKERLEIRKKMWKYNPSDFIEAEKWDKYRKYYKDVFKHCNDIPWHIIPSDQNWYKTYLVASLLRDTLKGLKMKYPGLKP